MIFLYAEEKTGRYIQEGGINEPDKQPCHKEIGIFRYI